jgi:hypothetical protein
MERKVVLRLDVIGDEGGLRLAEFVPRKKPGRPIGGRELEVRGQRQAEEGEQGRPFAVGCLS